MNELRSDTWNRATEASGTAYIFEVRARRLRISLNRLTFVGIAAPLLVGLIVLGYGTKFKDFGWLVGIAIAVGCAQVVWFTWSVVAGWANRYDDANRAIVKNRELAEKFASLARHPPATVADYRHELQLLDAADAAQRSRDLLQGITEAEKRMGMRAALLQYERKCRSCYWQPKTMIPTDCGLCGDFPRVGQGLTQPLTGCSGAFSPYQSDNNRWS